MPSTSACLRWYAPRRGVSATATSFGFRSSKAQSRISRPVTRCSASRSRRASCRWCATAGCSRTWRSALAEAGKKYDLLIKNVRVVRPDAKALEEADIAITGDKFSRIARAIEVREAKRVYDGKGRLAFPGVVDAHMHTGIYAPLAEDAVSESKAAAQGGVTSSLNYFRSGQYYLNKGGPYRDFFPEVLAISKARFHVDYGYHLAPLDSTHIGEIPQLVEKHG